MEEPKKLPAAIIPDVENAPPRIYSNVVVINHSAFDFTLNFLEFIVPIKIEEKTGEESKAKIEIITPIVARIALQPIVVPALIEALKINYGQYEAEKESQLKEKKAGK